VLTTGVSADFCRSAIAWADSVILPDITHLLALACLAAEGCLAHTLALLGGPLAARIVGQARRELVVDSVTSFAQCPVMFRAAAVSVMSCSPVTGWGTAFFAGPLPGWTARLAH
jgi:hypothetical protein